MIAALWRMLRVSNLETAGIDLQYEQFRHSAASAGLPPEATTAMRASYAWQSMGKSVGALDLMGRTEARLQRQFDSA